MSCFDLMDINYVDNAIITASTENALFPKSNLQDDRRTKVFRSTTNSDYLIFDLQETQQITHVFVTANKKSGIGVNTVTVELNATSNFTSPAFSQTMTISGDFDFEYVTFAQQSYRFCRIVMTSTLGYCEIANVYIGKSLSLVRSIDFNWSIKDEQIVSKQKNRYGQQFNDLIARQRVVSFAIKNMDKADLAKIYKLMNHCSEFRPVYLLLGTTDMIDDIKRFSGPFIFEDNPNITNPYFNKYNMTSTLREAM